MVDINLMKSKKFRKYAQFYLGLVLILFGLSRIQNPVTIGMAEGITSFLICRIGIIPIELILYKLVKEPNHTVFGIENTSFFGWLSIAFLLVTVSSLLLPTSISITKACIFFFLACLDATLASKYGDLKSQR